MPSYDEVPNIENGPEDLLAEVAAGLQSDTDAEVLAEAAEILTAERVSLGIVDRLSAAQWPVTMTLRSGCRVEGMVRDVGDRVVVLAGVDGAEQCIAIASVVTIRGLPSSLSPETVSNEIQRGQGVRRPAVGALTWGSYLRAESASESHGMGCDELPSLDVHPGDVVLELRALDPPLAPAANLDGRQVAAANKGVRLGGGDLESLRNVGQGEEARCHALIVPAGCPNGEPDPRPVDNHLAVERSWVILGRWPKRGARHPSIDRMEKPGRAHECPDQTTCQAGEPVAGRRLATGRADAQDQVA